MRDAGIRVIRVQGSNTIHPVPYILHPLLSRHRMEFTCHGRTLKLVTGDIAVQTVDAIVNAAYSRLAGGGGVDGAIHRAGEGKIMAETRRRYPQGCATGSAVITGAGELPAKYVIHAVGPVYSGGEPARPRARRVAARNCKRPIRARPSGWWLALARRSSRKAGERRSSSSHPS